MAEEAQPLPVRRAGFLERDGERLYWEDVGEGEALVLCHGAGGNHAVWYPQVAAFAEGRRVLVWDHRGFGRSTDRAGRSGPEVAIEDLEALLDHRGLARVDLVGQSMGGWTALGLATRRPERVRALVLADTLGGIASPEIERLGAELRRGPPPAPDRLGMHPALDPSFAGRDPARAYLYQLLGGFGEPDLATLLPRLLAHRQPAEALARVTMPVLFVVGERDPLFPPPVVRAAADALADARLAVIPDCGHSPYFEEPDVWNAIVERFLEEDEDEAEDTAVAAERRG
jgi:2-succinyl-6-hydroxy-2,4-cyclohexadiene-1-carboxylate synthase